jgi:hypothetical protein
MSGKGQTENAPWFYIYGRCKSQEDCVMKRRRIKHEKTFQERLAEEAQRFREAAQKLPPNSHAQELLLRRARQAETASHMNEWLTSPGLQPPTALKNLLSNQNK